MKIIPQLVDYSQIDVGEKTITKTIYSKTQRISIFLNGILLISIIFGFIYLYYRFINKEENEKNINNKIMKLNNLIYS